MITAQGYRTVMLPAVAWCMVICTPKGKMAPETKQRVPFAPKGVQNPWTMSVRTATIVLLVLDAWKCVC